MTVNQRDDGLVAPVGQLDDSARGLAPTMAFRLFVAIFRHVE
jgi:hypothetical protein